MPDFDEAKARLHLQSRILKYFDNNQSPINTNKLPCYGRDLYNDQRDFDNMNSR